MLTTTAQVNFDNVQAITEGWLITTRDDEGPYQLQKDDAQNTFPNDVQAWAFVFTQAESGSDYHKSAVEFLKENNNTYYLEMIEYLHDNISSCP
jgi:hypothetical protein